MIQRILTPQVFDLVRVGGWVAGVCAALHVPVSVVPHLREMCTQEHTQVLLGIEEEAPQALLVTQLPTPLMLYPTILLGYNAGSRALGREMMHEAAAFARAAGYTRLRMTNGSGRSDAVYLRGLHRVGMEPVEQVTAFTVELKEEEQNEVRPS